MSFLTDIQTCVPKQLRGKDVTFYGDWASFWTACQLSPEVITWHNPDGSIKWDPSRDTAHYQELFWSGDCFGLVLSDSTGPVTGVIYRRDGDTAEQVLRLGKGAGYTGLRAWLWDLGVRKIQYKIRKDDAKTHGYMTGMEAMSGGTRVTTDKGDSYLYHEVTLNERPKERQP